MTVFDILNFNRELLERISQSGIHLDDVRYVDLYKDYLEMTESGQKTTFTIAALSDKYSVSVRKIYQLIKHFKTDCTVSTR